jgi:hypothetical protein
MIKAGVLKENRSVKKFRLHVAIEKVHLPVPNREKVVARAEMFHDLINSYGGKPDEVLRAIGGAVEMPKPWLDRHCRHRLDYRRSPPAEFEFGACCIPILLCEAGGYPALIAGGRACDDHRGLGGR